MRFEVPQFIGIEDKIFGPLTIKQFVYLAGCAALAYISYRYLPFIVGIIVALPIIGLGLALAFYKVNNKPFIFVLEAAFKYVLGSRLYVWRKEDKPIEKRKESERPPLLYVPKMSQSKLRDLTWTLDVKDSTTLGTKETMNKR